MLSYSHAQLVATGQYIKKQVISCGAQGGVECFIAPLLPLYCPFVADYKWPLYDPFNAVLAPI